MAVERQEKPVRTREPLPNTDRILLSLLLTDAEARDLILPQLAGLPAVKTSPARRIYEALFALAASDAPVNLSQLHGRLEDDDREVLSESLFRESVAPKLEDGLACLESMRRTDLTAERDRMKSDIRDAERRGDLKEALRLMQELEKLK